MFLDEARLVVQLDHPGIVPVHELGKQRRRLLHRDGLRRRGATCARSRTGSARRGERLPVRARRRTSRRASPTRSTTRTAAAAPTAARCASSTATSRPRTSSSGSTAACGSSTSASRRRRTGRRRRRRGRGAARQVRLHEPGAGAGAAGRPPLRRVLARRRACTSCSPASGSSTRATELAVMEQVRRAEVAPPSELEPGGPARARPRGAARARPRARGALSPGRASCATRSCPSRAAARRPAIRPRSRG